MPNTKDPFGEDASLLYPGNRGRGYAGFTVQTACETPVMKGVANQLRKWPEDVFFAFLAACLIVASLAFLIVVTVLVCVPSVLGNRMEEILSILEVGASPNVYFLKLDKQNWSSREFCYMETAARKHTDLNVYLINLTREEAAKENTRHRITDRTSLEFKSNNKSTTTGEDKLRERLSLSGNGNIKIVDVSIDRFFESSRLANVARHLNDDVLEIAARAQLLWTVPGIALKPSMFCRLDSMKDLLCKNRDACSPDKLATIEPENDVQVTGVPCQAFMGFLVQQISSNNHNGRYTLMEAVKKYCPRSHHCPEVRILDSKRNCPTEGLDCPIVYTTILMHDYLNTGTAKVS